MKKHITPNFEIPLTEDLMREHGILNRILLIYEAIIDKIEQRQSFPQDALHQAVKIIQLFIEGHHERLEEDYIFPLFERHKKNLKLIATLKEQHIKGREISAQLITFLTVQKIDRTHQLNIKHLLQEFITMYRPHEAHEDTDIFPQVRSFMTEKEFEELGELFETFEHQILGPDGLKKILNSIEKIEEEIDIANLAQFTPDNI